MIDKIRNTLYPKIYHKTNFVIALADEFNLSPRYMKTHWFSAFWSIPEKHQERVVLFMENYINNQPIKKS